MNVITPRSKNPHIDLSIFAVMSALAAKHNAINLSQGFPDFDCHPRLINLAEKYMRAGHNQYAPMPGVPALRQALADKTEALYGCEYDPETEITITAGATEALYAAITAMVHAGDEVIIFEPYYDAYVPVVEYCGGVPVYITCRPPDYRIAWNEVRERINRRTRLMIFNSPHNPTGTVLEASDLQELSGIVSTSDLLLISDEVYEHIVFDDSKHVSFCQFPGLAERSFVISSFGKTYHTTGWKVGYCMAPRLLTAELRKIHQFITYAVNTPLQMAYSEILRDASFYEELSAFYQAKRDLFRSLLATSRFTLLPCNGTYFQLAGYSAISDEKEMDFARRLTTEHKVAAVPLSPFFHSGDENRILRFCFAKKDETLQQAAELLCRI